MEASPGGERRATRWLVAAAIVLSVVRYIPVIDDPWGNDLASGNGAWYSGQPVRNWMRLGFGEMRGMSMLGALPTQLPMGLPYAHHPPLFNWTVYAIVQALGLSERSFRVLPIALSALAGGMLVALACRMMGAAAGCVTGLLWLAIPMSYLFGVMCNPEAATVFAIVLVFWLHVRLRAASGWAYGLVALAQFLAGQMDWEGHFAVPAVLLYELLMPRARGRRIDRVVWLGVASVASAVVALVAKGFFVEVGIAAADVATTELPRFTIASIGRYLVEGVQGAWHTVDSTVFKAGSEVGGFSEFWPAQARYVTHLFTWPAAVALGAGVLLAFVRRTAGLVLGCALLVPGVLNAAIFPGHAILHDYWLYYLTPGVVITIAEIARMLGRRRIFAVALVAVIVGNSAWTDVQEVAARRTTGFRDLAGELDRMLDRDDEILVCDQRLIPVTFYTRRWVVAEASSSRAWEHVEGLSTLRKLGKIRQPVTLLLVPSEPLPLERLSAYGSLEMMAPAEVERRLPTSTSIYRGPIWLLRLS